MDKETKALLSECSDAMSEATRRYRRSWKLPGTGGNIAGWVEWLEKMQRKIAKKLNH